MICPAVLDPFQGSNYRLNACFHQALLCPLLCKFFCYIFTPTAVLKNAEHHYINIQQSCTINSKNVINVNNMQIISKKIDTIPDGIEEAADRLISNGINSGCDVEHFFRTDTANNFPNFCKKIE